MHKNKQSRRNMSQKSSVTAAPTSGVDYDKLRDSIVEANLAIKAKDEESKRKTIENDHSIKLLVELLDVLFCFAIVFLALFIIAAFIYPYSLFDWKQEIRKTIATSVYWALLIAEILIFSYMIHKRKKSNTVSKPGGVFALILASATFLYASFMDQAMFIAMTMVTLFLILLRFCYLAKKAIEHETDRIYLVSYFSAIVAMAALIVSVVTLYISLK